MDRLGQARGDAGGPGVLGVVLRVRGEQHHGEAGQRGVAVDAPGDLDARPCPACTGPAWPARTATRLRPPRRPGQGRRPVLDHVDVHAPGAELLVAGSAGWSGCRRRRARGRPASRSVRRGRDATPGSPASSIGSVNQNVLPSPGSLSTPMLPPIASTSCREMARPRPVPPNLRVVDESAWEKASKSRSGRRRLDADTGVGDLEPDDHAVVGPVLELGAAARPRRRSVNFTAFEARFSSTCRSRDGSPRRPTGSSGEQ